MAYTITHSTVSGAAANPSYDVDGPAWDANHTITGSVAASEITSGAALTKTDDTNVTLTLGGTPTTALLAATSVTVGWTGTLAAARLNSSVVHSVVNDTNVTGSIAAQALTLGWTGTTSPARGGTGVANNAASTITISGSFGTTFTVTGTTSLTLPTTGTLATLAGTEELDNKTLDSSVGKGTWTASGTWTLPAYTLGGTVSGGGNQINDVIIGTSSPRAGSFTTVDASTSLTSPIIKSAAAVQFQTNGTTFAGNITTGQQFYFGTTDVAPPTGPILTVSKNSSALPAVGTPAGISGTAQFLGWFGSSDAAAADIAIQTFGNRAAGVRYFSSSGTAAAQTATTATSLGANFAYGYTGSAYVATCGFIFTATETYSGTNSGGRMDIYATATGSTGIAIGVSVGAGFMVGDQTDPGAGAISATASIKSKSATAGVGYMTGAGGTVTQATNKATGVTLSKVCGAITMNAAALAGDTTVSFVLTNTAIAATDVLVLNHISGGTIGSYLLNAQAAAGSATINVRNITTGSLSEAVVIQYALIKGVNA